MKTKNLLLALLAGALFNLVLGLLTLKAQGTTAGTGQNEPILSGSTLKSEQVVEKADVVLIGQITQMGLASPAASNVASYSGTRVKVLKILRGSVDAEISVVIDVLALNNEEAPKVGGTYIFFIKKDPGWNIVLKLLPATDDTTTKIQKLLPTAPAGK